MVSTSDSGAEGPGAPGTRRPGWHVVLTGPGAADQRREALDFLAVSTGVRPGSYRISHRCPGCGAEDHGAPVLEYEPAALRRRGPDAPDAGAPRPAVSFSRAGGWLATAWLDAEHAAAGWRVGVDLEDAGSEAFADGSGLAGVGYSPDEEAALAGLGEQEQPGARAMLWAVKEAVVKAAGTGFTDDPADVAVTVPGSLHLTVPGHPEAVIVLGQHWPGGPPPEGLVGAVVIQRG